MNSDEKLYDIMLTEIFHLYKCYAPLAKKMNIPVMGTMTFKSWLLTDQAIANPNNPAYFPFDFAYDMYWECDNFFVRLRNFLDHLTVYCYWHLVNIPILSQFHRDHLQHVVPYHEYISMEPALVFYNTHHSYTSRPMNPNAIEVAGIHIKPVRPLPAVSMRKCGVLSNYQSLSF